VYNEQLFNISNDSLNFSPEHGDVDIDDGNPRPSITGQRSGDRAAGLGDVPFNLPNILSFVLMCKLTHSCKITFFTSFRPAFGLGLFVLA
jgi:hypothetical protein